MDRITWRDACQVCLSAYMNDLNQAAEDRRVRRHEISNKTLSGPCCPTCNKVCASDFGLRSHLRSHSTASSSDQRTTLRQKARQEGTLVGVLLSLVCSSTLVPLAVVPL